MLRCAHTVRSRDVHATVSDKSGRFCNGAGHFDHVDTDGQSGKLAKNRAITVVYEKTKRSMRFRSQQSS